MCGICGFAAADPRRPVERAVVEAMAATLRHRGPDGDGAFVAPGVGLGVRRLAIIDLATGDQPIANEDRTVTVVCNGEIYNFVELRRELEACGHRFRTNSDVEAIVHLYEDHGCDFLSHLRGMFSLALWDAAAHRLVLARDRFGIKPLVYAQTRSGLWFASEAKAVLAASDLDRALEPAAIGDILTFGFVLTPRTLFAAIHRLPPAHLLIWHDGRAELRRYWRFPGDAATPARTEKEWAEALLAKLEETVRLHLRSDVEVGAWLSPGVDSNAVALLAARCLGRRLHSVTLGFSDPLADETRGDHDAGASRDYAASGEPEVCDETALSLLPLAVWHMEEPSAYGNEVPRMLLARASARRVKVVLTGEGADEVFGGYSYFRANALTAPFAALPLLLRGLLAGTTLAARRPYLSALLLAPRAMGRERYRRLVGVVPSQAAERVMSPALRQRLREQGDGSWPPPADDRSPRPTFHELRRLEVERRLPDYVNHILDRAAMAFGLEARVPFLDHELAEMCAGIPPSLLLRASTEKYLLRRAMAPLLPAETCWRRKRGLGAPVGAWWRNGPPPFARELMSELRLGEDGYFDPGAVAEALRLHRAGHADLGQVLTAVLGIQTWDELFVKRRDIPTDAQPAV